MAREYYRFFNSSTNDTRSYDADDLASAFRALAVSGVAALDESCLKVSAEGSTLRTLAGYGSAVLKGYHYELRDDGGAQTAFAHSASAGNDRIDRIVLRLDLTARTIGLLKREGTAAASPVPPALVRTDSVYELSLAQVRVRDGASAIEASDVTDERADESVCGAALPEGAKLSLIWNRMAKALATPSVNGLMSAADKAKLNALDAALTPSVTTAGGVTTKALDLNGYKLSNLEIAYGDDGTVSAAVAQNASDIAALGTAMSDDTADTQIHVYTHARSDAGVHNFTGTGSNGRVKLTAQIQENDTFTVNGTAVTALANGVICTTLPVGVWLTFVYDQAGANVNFRYGTAGTTDENEPVCILVQGDLPAAPDVSDNSGTRKIYAAVVPAVIIGYAPPQQADGYMTWVRTDISLADVQGPIKIDGTSVSITAVTSQNTMVDSVNLYATVTLKRKYVMYTDGVLRVTYTLETPKLHRTTMVNSSNGGVSDTAEDLPLYVWNTAPTTPRWDLVD